MPSAPDKSVVFYSRDPDDEFDFGDSLRAETVPLKHGQHLVDVPHWARFARFQGFEENTRNTLYAIWDRGSVGGVSRYALVDGVRVELQAPPIGENGRLRTMKTIQRVNNQIPLPGLEIPRKEPAIRQHYPDSPVRDVATGYRPVAIGGRRFDVASL